MNQTGFRIPTLARVGQGWGGVLARKKPFCSWGTWLVAVQFLAFGGLGSSAENETVGAGRSPVRFSILRVDDSENPIGIDNLKPRLSWVLESSERNQRQTAFQVLVATAAALLEPGKADLWDSDRVASGDSVHVLYGGKTLAARQHCYWKVRIWDAQNRPAAWSEMGSWEMGLCGEWKAKWIGSGPAREPRPVAGFFKSQKELSAMGARIEFDGRSTLLRKSFALNKPVRQARLYATGLGYYELSCNGQRVGESVLAPPKSNYRKWVFYDVYDVTKVLQTGTNVVGIHLGNGWFNPYPKWWEPYRMQWFGSKRALVQMQIDYTDGSSDVVISDDSWKTARGPVLSSCVYDGEVYDGTQERPGWNGAGLNDAAWKAATIVEAPGGELVSCMMPPIRLTAQIRSVALTQPQPGVHIFDLGQNFAGWVRLTAKGARGTKIKLRYAEDLRPDGTLDVTSNEKALSTDTWIMSGKGCETYEPRFTFHGFRYVEVTGLKEAPKQEDVVGCVIHNACRNTGSFACGNELINRIHRAVLWSQRSNLMGYPMDCPQRDERLGWFGDAMASVEEAMFNFDMSVFYRQWLDGVRRNQNESNGDISIISPRPYMTDEPDPTWSSAYILMVWQHYLHYGDRRVLAEHFDSMRRYVDFLGTQATNNILPKYWIGDWGTVVEGWKEGEPVSVSTGFYYLDAEIVSKSAAVLGRRSEADQYEALGKAIRAAFKRTFYDKTQKHFDQGTQFSNVFPLFLGMADPADEPAILKNIVLDLQRRNGHFNVGVLGAKYLIDGLTKYGREDLAYALATQTGYPSWAEMLKGGRTTLSEFWDLHGSHNHIMMGSIDAWFYRSLAGIQVDERDPGFSHVVIKPFVPASLPSVSASIDTVRGKLSVEWEQREKVFHLRLTLPVNSKATVFVPVSSGAKVESDPPLKPVRAEKTAAIFELGSGVCDFRVTSVRR
jgi:alpha-L-rhamnosidase